MTDTFLKTRLALDDVAQEAERDMTLAAIHVEAWAAVLTNGLDEAPRRFGDYVDESVIPAAHRRRLGSFGRMAVSCGLSVAGADSSDLIFCSRYGDLNLAYRLLEALAKDELLSPAAFSLSVHNAVPGVMDLVRKSRVGHTAISAGSQSLSAGLVEAWAKLTDRPDRKVTLVYSEGVLPEDLRHDEQSQAAGVALALTLTIARCEREFGGFRLASLVSRDVEDEVTSEVLAERLINVLHSGAGKSESISWQSRGLCWTFVSGADAAS